MFWIIAIVIAIFVIPPILGIVLGVKSHQIANDEKNGIDWWTIGMIADLHNKASKKERK